jgi:hypothetical protein
MQKLGNEAEKIYYAVFKKQIPETIRVHFEHISKSVDDHYPDDEVGKYRRCISSVKDLEALEVAARHLGKLPVLTDKLRIMICISEAFPENYPVFVNDKDNRFAGYGSILFSLFRTCYKLTKGMIFFAASR